MVVLEIAQVSPYFLRARTRAIDWFLRMQIMSGKFKGGFLSGLNFSWLSHSAPFIYTEITGYGLKMLLNLFENGESALIQRVRATADFLLKMQSDDGPFVRGVLYRQNRIIDTCYTFDTAICTSALLDLFVAEHDNKFISSSQKAGYWLVEKAQTNDGSFRSKYRDGKFSGEGKWYGDGCCLHGKNIICLLKLWSKTGKQAFRLSAEKTADWVMTLQLPNGAFKVSAKEDYVFTHAHCYVVEGLLYAYYVTKKNDYLSSAIKAAEWLTEAQGDNGGLLNLYGNISLVKKAQNNLFPIRMETVDAVAQAIRIWVAIYSLTKDITFLRSAYKAAIYLLRARCKKENPNLHGGFYHQVKGPFRLPITRTWSCIFAIQALRFLTNPNQEFGEMMQNIM